MKFIEKLSNKDISKSELIKFRLRYAGIHLLISIAIGIIALCWVFLVWYPSPLAKALGVASVFFMMVGIDIVLGPLLTLLVAKPQKKTLKFDLAVIALLQAGALLYGIYNIGLGRPAYLAFDVTRFEVAEVKNIDKNELQSASSPYNKLPLFHPQWVAVARPKTANEQLERMMVQLETGYPQTLKASLYEPLDNQWQIILDEAKPLMVLNDYNNPAEVEKIINKYPQARGFVPLKTNGIDMTVLVGENNFIRVVDLRPWN